jgi:hypothetical protein
MHKRNVLFTQILWITIYAIAFTRGDLLHALIIGQNIRVTD